MELLGERRGALSDMRPDGRGRVRLDYTIPARGLIGFRTEFLTNTAGTGLIYHNFSHDGPCSEGNIAQRGNGALVSNSAGKSVAFALFNLQERGKLSVSPGEDIYEGMIIGIHARANDLVVNPMKAKHLTNIRAAGKDDAVTLTTIQPMSLERALDFIKEDERVEVTPKAIRLRKAVLAELGRVRAARSKNKAG